MTTFKLYSGLLCSRSHQCAAPIVKMWAGSSTVKANETEQAHIEMTFCLTDELQSCSEGRARLCTSVWIPD